MSTGYTPPDRRPAEFSGAPREQALEDGLLACRRFSAWSKTMLRGPSSTSSVISSPRCAGRQCSTQASGACASSARVHLVAGEDAPARARPPAPGPCSSTRRCRRSRAAHGLDRVLDPARCARRSSPPAARRACARAAPAGASRAWRGAARGPARRRRGAASSRRCCRRRRRRSPPARARSARRSSAGPPSPGTGAAGR